MQSKPQTGGAKGPGGTKTEPVGAKLTLKAKGVYHITMVKLAPDNRLILKITDPSFTMKVYARESRSNEAVVSDVLERAAAAGTGS